MGENPEKEKLSWRSRSSVCRDPNDLGGCSIHSICQKSILETRWIKKDSGGLSSNDDIQYSSQNRKKKIFLVELRSILLDILAIVIHNMLFYIVRSALKLVVIQFVYIFMFVLIYIKKKKKIPIFLESPTYKGLTIEHKVPIVFIDRRWWANSNHKRSFAVKLTIHSIYTLRFLVLDDN